MDHGIRRQLGFLLSSAICSCRSTPEYHILCRSSVPRTLCPQQPPGMGSHCPSLMEKNVWVQDPSCRTGMPEWHHSAPPTLYPGDLGSTEIAADFYRLFLSHLNL